MNKKTIIILNKIYKASEDDKLDWTRFRKKEDWFRSDFGDNFVTIRTLPVGKYQFTIHDKSGHLLFSTLKDNEDIELKNLYNLARTKALHFDNSLDEINDALDELLKT